MNSELLRERSDKSIVLRCASDHAAGPGVSGRSIRFLIGIVTFVLRVLTFPFRLLRPRHEPGIFVRFLWVLLGFSMSAGAVFCILFPWFKNASGEETLSLIAGGVGLFGLSRFAFFCGLKAMPRQRPERRVEPNRNRAA
jgi:hypothetical protein